MSDQQAQATGRADSGNEITEILKKKKEQTKNKLEKLCNDCLPKLTKATFGRSDVIPTLGKVGRGFAANLSQNIITEDTWQMIDKASTNTQALGYIRMAFNSSLEPKMFEEVIEAIKLTGKTQQANKIEEAYYEEIVKYELCRKCKNH